MTFLSACRLVCEWRHMRTKVPSCAVCVAVCRPERQRGWERERKGESRASAERHGDEAESAKASISGGEIKTTCIFEKKNSQKTTKPKNKQNRDIAVGNFDRSFAFFPCTDIKWKGYLAACWILNLILHRCGVDFRVAQAESVWVVCWRNFRHSGSNLSWTSRNQSGSKLNHLPTALTACRTL